MLILSSVKWCGYNIINYMKNENILKISKKKNK